VTKLQAIGLVLGLMVVSAALAVIIWVFVFPEGAVHRADLVLSLTTEVIGALLTTLTVGYIFKLLEVRREERRRLPARCMLYARMTEQIDKLLIGILPVDTYEVAVQVYTSRYGDTCTPTIEEVGEEWPSEVRQSMEGRVDFDALPLREFSLWLNQGLERSRHLLEPEPVRDLTRLKQKLTSSLMFLADTKWDDERSRREFAHSLVETAHAALEVKGWLQEMLKKHFVVDDEYCLFTS
jgi:hypothetical protein